ncbi:MAG: hypothetical protein JWO38_2168 [Gemmataceae bacterium]|nr:hypothetical protein [Gemmataceae bacterium]
MFGGATPNAKEKYEAEGAFHAALLRDVFGNPFLPGTSILRGGRMPPCR